MPIKLICASHSPLMKDVRPDAAVEKRVRDTFARLADDVRAFDPQLIVAFYPDHLNGFFYDLMPPFCVGLRATSAGDWGYENVKIKVPEAQALQLVKDVLASGVDTAYSYRLQVDHGVTQLLDLLVGETGDRYPTIPVFVNGATKPFSTPRRVIALGQAVGRHLLAKYKDQRVLVLGSGGLSHDPPTPQFGAVPPEVEEFLISGRNPTPEARAKRQANVIATGQALARGEGTSVPLDPEWDEGLLESFRTADFDRLGALTDEEILTRGGRGGNEIRAWIAAFAALAEYGAYDAKVDLYEAIDVWIAGFGIMSAAPRVANAATGAATGAAR